MFLGIEADISEIGGQVGEAELGDIATAAVVGMVNNVASKTYMQGMIDVVEAIADPQRYPPSLMNNYASAMVPQSSFMRDIRKVQDPHMREVRSLVDSVKNTIPGYSNDLPARRSWITGEAIAYPKGWGADMTSPLGEAFAAANPIIAGDWKQDRVLDELARLDFAFSPPVRKIEGVELTTAQYSRLLEIHGTVRVQRKTMYQALEHVMDSHLYDMDRERFGDTSEPSENLRVKAVQRVITNYRKAARNKLLEEDPQLREQVIGAKQEMYQQSRSVYGGITDLLDE